MCDTRLRERIYHLACEGLYKVFDSLHGCYPFIPYSCRWRFQSNRFVALKIHTVDKEDNPLKYSQVQLAEAIIHADPKHEALRYLRTPLESFTIPGQSGHHLCLAYAPMRENLSTFQRRLRDGRISVSLLKPLLRFLLLGLDYLHTKCHIIHTGIFKTCFEARFLS